MKRGLAQMLKGGVIMDVVDVAQARIAEVCSRFMIAPCPSPCFSQFPEELHRIALHVIFYRSDWGCVAACVFAFARFFAFARS